MQNYTGQRWFIAGEKTDMKNVVRIVCVVCMCLAVSNAQATDIYSKAGTRGLSFLKIGLGARAGAMGESYVAVANDATSVLWNPAGLCDVQGKDVLFSHNQWFEDIRSEYVGTAMRFGKNGFGLGFILNNVSDIEHRAPQTGTLLGLFNAYDVALVGAYGRQVREDLSLGLALKLLYEKMYVYSSSGFACDFGARYHPPVKNVTLAAAIQNVGNMSAMRDEEMSLPLTARAGLAYVLETEPLHGDLLLSADVSKSSDYRATFHTGLEYTFDQRFALRGGYLFGHDDRGLSAGIGLSFRTYRLDYAYIPFDLDLGNTHRLTFGISL